MSRENPILISDDELEDVVPPPVYTPTEIQNYVLRSDAIAKCSIKDCLTARKGDQSRSHLSGWYGLSYTKLALIVLQFRLATVVVRNSSD